MPNTETKLNPELTRYLEQVKSTEIELKSVVMNIEAVRAALESGGVEEAKKAALEVEQHFSTYYARLMFNWELFPECESDDDE